MANKTEIVSKKVTALLLGSAALVFAAMVVTTIYLT
jgi:hypothetical protein